MGRGRAETARGARIRGVKEIAAAVVRLAKGGEPPRIARIRTLYPGVAHDRVSEGYRVGCLDLVLTPGGRPILGDTREERDAIQARVARLCAWRLTHPSYYTPARSERCGLKAVRGRAGPTA